MTIRGRIYGSLMICTVAIPQARALFNLNEGTDTVLVTASAGLSYDSNVFTRATAKSSFTQTGAASVDYRRGAGLLGVEVIASLAAAHFDSVRGQDFVDPSLGVTLRKLQGRTTGDMLLRIRRESQADPDAGERTQDWNYNAGLDLRYPVNDRYYFTNNVATSLKAYTNNPAFTDLTTFSDSLAINYVYTSKLDLNGGYTIGISDTSRHTRAYDHSFTVGATGAILAKLSGTIRVGFQQRDSDTPGIGRETFNAFTSATSLTWLFSRRLSFNADLNEDFSTTSTNIPVNRASGGLRATASLGSKYTINVSTVYTLSDFLGQAGAGRRDDLLQWDGSVGIALTRNIRTSLGVTYMNNTSNAAVASFSRESVTLSIAATY